MNIDIKWNDIQKDNHINQNLIDTFNRIKHKEFIDSVDANIFKRENSRHIIDVTIKTKNPDEYLYSSGNAFNLIYSLNDLNRNLSKTMKQYDPNKYAKQKALEQEWEAEREHNRKLKEERIAKEFISKEEMKKRKLAEKKRAELEAIEKKNELLAKRFEKKRQEELEIEKKILEELEARKKEIEQEEIEEALKNKKALDTLQKQDGVINEDLNEDSKIQEDLKVSKDKLMNLYAEENECLVIAAAIKKWNKKVFSDRYYKPNEPFKLVDTGRTFYHDGLETIYVVDPETNEWVVCNDIDVDFNLLKEQKLLELEQKLIVARSLRKHHLTDLVDEGEIADQLKKSKTVLSERQKMQDKEIAELKKDQKLIAELTKNEMKLKISDKMDDIDIVELHPANEQFQNDNGVWCYHDGEGNYYAVGEQGEWIATSKSYVYASNELLNLKLPENHKANESFINSKNIYFYHDGFGHYFKLDDNNWVSSSYEECYPNSAKLIKKRKEKLNKILNNKNDDSSYADLVNDANEEIQKDKWDNISEQATQQFNNDETQATNEQTTESDQNILNSNQDTNDAGQQWQDEYGTWWYLDAYGNYYYADAEGNWIPYQQQA